MPTATRKTIRIEDLRKVKGDKWVDDFLSETFGPKLASVRPIKVERQSMETVLAILEGKHEGQVGAAVPATLRLYYRENPQARGKLMNWLRFAIAQIAAGDPFAAAGMVKAPSPNAHGPRNKRQQHPTSRKVVAR